MRFEADGVYHKVWLAVQEDDELTAVVRSRQLHIYRGGKKVLVLAGKAAPKVLRADNVCSLIQTVSNAPDSNKAAFSLDALPDLQLRPPLANFADYMK